MDGEGRKEGSMQESILVVPKLVVLQPADSMTSQVLALTNLFAAIDHQQTKQTQGKTIFDI